LVKLKEKLSILHVVLSIGETNATYNEHCLPMVDERDISICTYSKSSLTPPKSITFFEGDGSLVGFLRNLNHALSVKSYDIVHAHSPHVGLLVILLTLFRHKKAFFSSVITIHDSYANFKLRNKLLLIPVFARYRKVICCGQASFDSFPAFYKWLAGERIGFVQNGLDIDRVDLIASKPIENTRNSDEFTVIGISRLVEVKNPYSVLKAFQLSDTQKSRLVYIGEGPMGEALKEEVRTMGLDNKVEFTGLIPREKVFSYLLQGDLFFSASRGEGLPIAVLEAMACGCPVLLSDIPPHREIANGVDFIPLADPDELEVFAQKINSIAALSKTERESLGQKCRKLVEDRFSLKAMHAGYAKVYSQVIDNHNN